MESRLNISSRSRFHALSMWLHERPEKKLEQACTLISLSRIEEIRWMTWFKFRLASFQKMGGLAFITFANSLQILVQI